MPAELDGFQAIVLIATFSVSAIFVSMAAFNHTIQRHGHARFWWGALLIVVMVGSLLIVVADMAPELPPAIHEH